MILPLLCTLCIAFFLYIAWRYYQRHSKRFVLAAKIVLALAAGLLLLRIGLPFLGLALGISGMALSLLQQWHGWKHLRQSHHTHTPRSTNMTKAEALKILGLDEHASQKDVIAAYRRLMAKNHPDQGGSDYLAQQINEAKRLLLGK